ncbi:MAG: 5'/3'-nucleotidase SurE [Acutalibacter sp.]|jgi:5'-nucleotidase
MPVHILLVNDDGIHSSGLGLLARRLKESGHQVTVVAPDRERSAVGHGITLRDPLFVQDFDWEGIPAYSCSGTPADCTQLGLKNLAEGPVDLVVSGPNRGLNLAGDLLYSGTVAAALEGAKKGVKAIALSAPKAADLETVIRVFLRILAQLDLDRDVRPMLNINVPALPWEEIRGIRWATQGNTVWLGSYQERVSPDGRRYFWCAGGDSRQDGDEESDFSLLQEGYVTLTPLTYEMTHREGFSQTEFVL